MTDRPADDAKRPDIEMLLRTEGELEIREVLNYVIALESRLAAEMERDRLTELINHPHNADWFEGTKIEAAHQQERWGSQYDDGKGPLDWFWLIGYLSQKATMAEINGDTEKAKHHTISTAAALLNWHRRLSGERHGMRPGIEEPAALRKEQ